MPEATREFQRLCDEHLFRWSYEEFLLVWPKELGDVSRRQWIAKNRIEKLKRTVPSKAETQKGKRQKKQTSGF